MHFSGKYNFWKGLSQKLIERAVKNAQNFLSLNFTTALDKQEQLTVATQIVDTHCLKVSHSVICVLLSLKGRSLVSFPPRHSPRSPPSETSSSE